VESISLILPVNVINKVSQIPARFVHDTFYNAYSFSVHFYEEVVTNCHVVKEVERRDTEIKKIPAWLNNSGLSVNNWLDKIRRITLNKNAEELLMIEAPVFVSARPLTPSINRLVKSW